MNEKSTDVADVVGRILIALIFLMAGAGKLGTGYGDTLGFMANKGVPGILLPFAILTEIGCAALIIAGLWTRVTALVLAAYTLLVALLFHLDLSVKLQQIMFLKNLAITGGLLLLAAKGAGRWSIDRQKRNI